ncbi:MAG: ABC transporter permease subunit [Planctomycetaceae bacterium]|nr:ABC transporter permease subunit [Planctomycetaceae bacterium]
MSSPLLSRIGLPLLAKELLEQSARKRTYVLRTLYACLLFFGGLMMFYGIIYDGARNPLSVLGRGKNVFEALVGLQLAGIYLFMPAITCTVITAEKERKTLGLLLLTKLGPWTIVLEKYLGRCITMLTFLILSLPLMAFAYSLGGVNARDLVVASWMLLITTLQVGAFAVMCSCLFRSTVGAFVGTYLLGFAFYFGPLFLWATLSSDNNWLERVRDAVNVVLEPFVAGVVISHHEQVLLLWVPAVLLFENWNVSLSLAFVRSLPTLVSIAALLCLARVFLVKRAFVPAKNPLLNLFRKLDGLFARLNQNRVTKGIVLIQESTTLPADEPIAWRETKKKSLGTIRYLIRVFLLLEVPVLAFCLLIVIVNQSWSGMPDELSLMYFLVWGLAALLVVVKATSLIAGERTHETLDVLLTTPLTTREIVAQKLRGLWRLMFVVAVPLLTIIAFETWWRSTVTLQFGTGRSAGLYCVASLLAVGVYLPLLAWLSLSIGMRTKTQARALFASLAAIVGWCIVPIVLLVPFFAMVTTGPSNAPMYLLISSPATIIPFTEFSALHELGSAPWTLVIVNFLFYLLMAVVVRSKCLSDASRSLGRAEPR